MSYDVVTIGAATQDVFMVSKNFRPYTIRGNQFNMLEYGGKIEVEDVVYDTGGGATNAAVTFARQGLHTACIAKLGVDAAAREIIHVLAKEKINTEHLVKSTRAHTGFSVLLKPFGGDRTVLVHRGASEQITNRDLDLANIKTKWFYISSLGGDVDMLKMILDWANRHGILVAINPGSSELKKRGAMLKILKRAQIIIMNLEEAAMITGEKNPAAVIKKFYSEKIHTALITDGPKGSYVLHDNLVFKSGIYKKVRVIDRTGAGDAFGSGFVSSVIAGATMEQALSFAAANSTSVVSYIGAKTGILRTKEVQTINVRRTQL